VVQVTVTSSRESSTASASDSASDGNVFTQTSTVAGGSVVLVTSTAMSTSTAGSDVSRSKSNGGLIGGVVGGVVGGLALLTALVLLLFLWRRRKSRTGHGWFLCFGTRPKSGNKDFDVDWPTFDPTSGAAGVGGTRRNNAQGGTLPELVDDEGYGNDGEMSQVGNNYYGAAAAAGAVGAGAAAAHHQHSYSNGGHQSGSYNGLSDEDHYRNQQQGWGAMTLGAAGVGAAGTGVASDAGDSVPTYEHLDPPEVRQARAREQAQAQAHAQAMAAAYGHNQYSPPMQTLPPYYAASSTSSPPLPSSTPRPLSDHRLSTGTTQAFANSKYPEQPSPEETGTLQVDDQRRLQLHNPDA
jgi:hypothetical protein